MPSSALRLGPLGPVGYSSKGYPHLPRECAWRYHLITACNTYHLPERTSACKLTHNQAASMVHAAVVTPLSAAPWLWLQPAFLHQPASPRQGLPRLRAGRGPSQRVVGLVVLVLLLAVVHVVLCPRACVWGGGVEGGAHRVVRRSAAGVTVLRVLRELIDRHIHGSCTKSAAEK
jgi:hypothetical protein